MKRTRRWAGVVIAGLVALPLSLAGQDGPRRARGVGAMGEGGSVEGVMRMRERLGLTEQQLQQLDAIRREQVAEQSERQARLTELRSRAQAGDIGAAELREALRAGREEVSTTREARRERVLSLLDQAQRDSLQQISARAQAFRMGRQSALRGRGDDRGGGVRGGQGFGRGGGFPGARPRGRVERFREGFRPDGPGPEGAEGPRRPRRAPGPPRPGDARDPGAEVAPAPGSEGS